MIAAMKGELRVARGDSGGLTTPGGGEEGAQGEGWARLPELTYSLGAATGTQRGLRGHRSVASGARRRVRPASGRWSYTLGPDRPSGVFLAAVTRLGALDTQRGSPKKVCLRVAALGTL